MCLLLVGNHTLKIPEEDKKGTLPSLSLLPHTVIIAHITAVLIKQRQLGLVPEVLVALSSKYSPVKVEPYAEVSFE